MPSLHAWALATLLLLAWLSSATTGWLDSYYVLCTTCVSFARMDIEDHTQYSQGVEREDFRLYK